MLRVADYVMNCLRSEGVGHIFMVTGRGSLFLTDAVAKLSGLVGICTHHEQAAAYAAVAYAQYNEKLGACLVSTGCASTNALTGVLSAWQDGVPCIFISGQHTLRETSRYTGVPLRTYGQQEADIVRIVESITKYAVMITDPSQVVYEMGKALHLAQTGRKGPVWIDIPLDIQSALIDPDQLTRFVPINSMDDQPTEDDLHYLDSALKVASRPVLLIGSGVRSAGAIPELQEFLRLNPIPVAYTASASDTIGVDHPLLIGSVGTMGCSRAGNFTVQNADLLIVLGSRLTSMTVGADPKKFARSATIIVIDIDEVEHSKKFVRIDRFIRSDLKALLVNVLRGSIVKNYQEWTRRCQHWKEIFPKCEESFRVSEKIDLYLLAQALTETLPVQSVFISDSGLAEIILPTNISFGQGRRCIHPVSQGAMGFALPAAVGAYLASGQTTVAVIGDGSVMMNLQELQTIRHHNLPIKILIVSNNVYAIIRRRQTDLFRKRTIGTDPSNGVSCPNFRDVAHSFNIPYARIDSSEGLFQRLEEVINTPGPVLCEILGKEDQGYIESMLTRNSQGRLVQRPIEDQAPFLGRELFLSEMVIEPIDQ